MRKPFVAGNWKMNKNNQEAEELARQLKEKIAAVEGADILICPPFTSLSLISKVIKDTGVFLGAQNMHWEESGAFTGEVSAQMLKSAGCGFVLIGHSERRKYFSESNQVVNKKIKAALKASLSPIVCVGETLEEREAGKEKDIVGCQLEEGLASLGEQDLGEITIAYEPVWAIGTGKTATGLQAEQMHAFIREWLEKKYSSSLSNDLRILYGGSVKASNTKELMGQKNIDGTLVGGASLDASGFAEIVKNSL